MRTAHPLISTSATAGRTRVNPPTHQPTSHHWSPAAHAPHRIDSCPHPLLSSPRQLRQHKEEREGW